MKEEYYRECIAKVRYNEEGLRETGEKGFEDFSCLWNIINDDDLSVSDNTYFEALDLCTESFFGSIQDPLPVWKHITHRYKRMVENGTDVEAFEEAFIHFLTSNHVVIPDMELFYALMHVAIERGNIDVARGILDHSPIEIESMDELKVLYRENPEWAAYIECLTDISSEELPDDPTFRNTVHTLNSKFGKLL